MKMPEMEKFLCVVMRQAFSSEAGVSEWLLFEIAGENHAAEDEGIEKGQAMDLSDTFGQNCGRFLLC